MATLVATTVDGAGTADYATLNLAEAGDFGATGADLVTNDEYCECSLICTDSNADTASVAIGGQTVDSTRYIQCEVPSAYRTPGLLPSAGNYYRHVFSGGNGLTVQAHYTKLIGIPFYNGVTTANDKAIYVAAADNVTIADCVVVGDPTCTQSDPEGIGFVNCDGTALVYNTIIYDFKTTAADKGEGIRVDEDVAGTFLCNNVTIVDCDDGFERLTGTVTLKNCLAFGNTDDYNGTFGGTCVFNGHTNGQSGPNGGSDAIDLGASGALIFKDYSGNDFHLLDETSPAYQVGTDLSGDTLPITTDIDGEGRPASPCIGADEYIIPASGARGAIIYPYEPRRKLRPLGNGFFIG